MNNLDKTERFALTPSLYLLLRRADEILLLRRANTGYMDGMYCLVAGHLEAGEPARDGMAREAKEEAGIIINPSDLRLVHTGHRYNRSRIDLFFEATIWQGEVKNMEPNKCDDLSWFSNNHVPDNTIPYVQSVLQLVSQGIGYSEYFEEI